MQTQMPATISGERRRKTRKRPITLVYVELASANGGMMRDLSEEGFAMRAMMPLRTGEITRFTFSLSQNVRIEGEGKILWVEEEGRVAGIEFTQVSGAAREQIREWLTHPEAPPSRDKAAEKGQAPAPGTPPPLAKVTMEQLREELHAVPSRPEGVHALDAAAVSPVAETAAVPKVEAPAPVVETPPTLVETVMPPSVAKPQIEHAEAPVPPPAVAPLETSAPVKSPIAETPTKKEAQQETAAPPAQEPAAPLLVQKPFEPPNAPELPRLRLTPQVSHAETEAKVSTPPQAPEPIKREKWPLTANAGLESETHESAEVAATNVPDISSILMQPSGKEERLGNGAPFESIALWETEQPPRESWVSVATVVKVMTLLALAAGLYVFHRDVGSGLISLGEYLGGVSQTSPRVQTQPAQTGTEGAQAEPPSAQTSSSPGASPSAGGNSGQGKAAADTAPTSGQTSLPGSANNAGPPVSPLSEITPPASAPNVEQGQAEYVEAMQILRSRAADGELSEAVRLLWASVEKGNPNAELALAEMYWEGRGVARNCDQTRILLTAAARKGSADAQKRLQQFEKQGCE